MRLRDILWIITVSVITKIGSLIIFVKEKKLAISNVK